MEHRRYNVGSQVQMLRKAVIFSALVLALIIGAPHASHHALAIAHPLAQSPPLPLTPTPSPETPPSWWYTPPVEQGLPTDAPPVGRGLLTDAPLAPHALTNITTAVDLPSSQSLNAGVIPLHVKVTADGTTPEVIVQVVSEQVPDQAVFAGYDKSPGGAVQNLYGFQQARFIGGVGTDGVAEVTFNYEALGPGGVNFTIKVWVADALIHGPAPHAIYIEEVTPEFTDLNATVSPDTSQCLNAGAIPLSVRVTADGPTSEIIVQVVSDDVPDRAVYAGYEKHPDGAVQNLYGFQQARFPGGVDIDHTAAITFTYEPLEVGTLNFTVKIWEGDNLWYGPVDHAVYVSEVTPRFNSLDPDVNLPVSQGLNAGVIPLHVKVTADGKTPEIAIHVVSDDVPNRAVYVGADKHPDGTVQNLYGFQQARFPGGVGPEGVAEATFHYESLNVGWVVFTVKIWVGDLLWYGPVQHAIYLWEAGDPSTICPPLIYDFAVAAQDDNRTTFSFNAIGNPSPQYDLACGSTNADANLQDLSCVYHESGTYTATLTASSTFENGVPSDHGTLYTDIATTTVNVALRPPPTPTPTPVGPGLPTVAPTFTWTGVVTWTGVLTRQNAAGEVVTMNATLLEPLAIPTGTLPITVTYTTIMASQQTVYAQDGQVTVLPAGALWRATAMNAGGSTSVDIRTGHIPSILYLPLILRQ